MRKIKTKVKYSRTFNAGQMHTLPGLVWCVSSFFPFLLLLLWSLLHVSFFFFFYFRSFFHHESVGTLCARAMHEKYITKNNIRLELNVAWHGGLRADRDQAKEDKKNVMLPFHHRSCTQTHKHTHGRRWILAAQAQIRTPRSCGQMATKCMNRNGGTAIGWMSVFFYFFFFFVCGDRVCETWKSRSIWFYWQAFYSWKAHKLTHM